MLDQALWFTGILTWVALGLFGAAQLADVALDFVANWFWTHREFLAFVADRLRKKHPKP